MPTNLQLSPQQLAFLYTGAVLQLATFKKNASPDNARQMLAVKMQQELVEMLELTLLQNGVDPHDQGFSVNGIEGRD
jgi:hypothetical protein